MSTSMSDLTCNNKTTTPQNTNYTTQTNMNSPKTHKRRIQFASNDVCSSDAILDHENVSPHDIWYQGNELSHMKRKAMVVAKESNKHGYASLLTNLYGKTCEETQKAMNRWACHGGLRRGLERWIHAEYAAKRADIRQRTLQSVLRAQLKLEEADDDYRATVLARLSETFSQDARNWARLMGTADACAAAEESSSAALTEKEAGRAALARRSSPTSVMSELLDATPLLTSPHPARQIRITRALGADDMRHYY